MILGAAHVSSTNKIFSNECGLREGGIKRKGIIIYYFIYDKYRHLHIYLMSNEKQCNFINM